MREWISLLEEGNIEDFSFVDNLTKMLNIKKEEIDNIIEKLSVDELSDLIDAAIKNNVESAQKIISSKDANNTNIENGSENSEPSEEKMNDVITNKFAKRSREQAPIDETAENVVLNIGDEVSVDGRKGIVAIPSVHGLVGIKFNDEDTDGELEMIKKEKVHVNEGVLGMTPMPGLQRMQELAGIRGEESNTPSEIEPVYSINMQEPMDVGADDSLDMDYGPDMVEPQMSPMATVDEPMDGMEDGAEAIESAISEIESHIPNVSISDYKSIVARLKALVSMAENAGRTALAESRKAAAKLVIEHEKIDLPEDKIEVKQLPVRKERKTLLDYIEEQDNTQFIGKTPQEVNAHLAAIADNNKNNNNNNNNDPSKALIQKGIIKKAPNGSYVTTELMSDSDLANAVSGNTQ